MAKRKDRKALISIYKENLKEVNKRFNEATPKMKKSALFQNAVGTFGELTRTKNTRQISQGKIGNFGLRRLERLIAEQQKFLRNPLTTKKGQEARYEEWKKNYLASRPQAKETTKNLYNINDEEYKEIIDILSKNNASDIFNRVLDTLEEVNHDLREKTVVGSELIIEAVKRDYTSEAINSAMFKVTSKVIKEEEETSVEVSVEQISDYWWEELENLKNA